MLCSSEAEVFQNNLERKRTTERRSSWQELYRRVFVMRPYCRSYWGLLKWESKLSLNLDILFWKYCTNKSKGWIALKWQSLWETNKFPVSFCSPFKFVRRFFVEKKRAITNNKGADQPARTRRLICAFVFAHILRRVFSATLAMDQAQVALLLYEQLFNGVLIYTHWNIGSTFVRGWIRNWIVVKVTLL